jgi:hypothetical protein
MKLRLILSFRSSSLVWGAAPLVLREEVWTDLGRVFFRASDKVSA